MNDIVSDYYNANAGKEQKRLDLPLCRIEFASTLRLIDKYFPASGRVCDIGGATGRYTIELLRKGYSVTLLDLSAEEIRLAGLDIPESGLSADQLLVGDARDLNMLSSGVFDAALCMGPMYHILDRDGRAKVLGELRRILKPGGITIIAYLNAWGILKTGLTDFSDSYKDMDRSRALLTEQTFRPQSASDFTECYLSTPPAALLEVRQAGYEVVSYAGAESFVGGMGLLVKRLALEMPEAYENVVTFASETCELEQYRDSTDHLHIVASAGPYR